jgi:hypothetical protein
MELGGYSNVEVSLIYLLRLGAVLCAGQKIAVDAFPKIGLEFFKAVPLIRDEAADAENFPEKAIISR